MGTQRWNIEQLKTALEKREELKGWILIHEHFKRRERYLMQRQASLTMDQDREVNGENLRVRVMVLLPKDGRQGEASRKLFMSEPLTPQIDSAIEAALQTDYQEWSLPEENTMTPPRNLPQLKTSDPKMAENLDGVMKELTARISNAALKPRNSKFNSAELFLSLHDLEVYNSRGLTYRYSQSRIYTEAAFSFSKKLSTGEMISDEYLNTRWAIALEDFPIEGLFEETAERAEQTLDVHKPESGRYPVIVDAEVLGQLISAQASQISATNSYHGLPFVKQGDELFSGAKGDLVSITLDPSLDYGADTVAISEQGLRQVPLKLVENNRVVGTSADQQFGEYLGMKPTTVRGTVVLSPGSMTREKMTQSAPRVLEILQFSALVVDPNRGTFSSEIRLARLFDNETKTVKFLKGGSLSGSLRENMLEARFTQNCVKRANFSTLSNSGSGYYGPEFGLLNDVSVVG
ncbi:metallopeptidase TldD-related protein [Bdellovibrionota bacterium FG-2]